MELWTLPRRAVRIPSCMFFFTLVPKPEVCAHPLDICRAGNAAGIFISGGICAITTWLWPDNFDFDVRRTRHLQNGMI